MASLAGAASNYSDLNGLRSISALGRVDRNAALGEVARQFESLLIAQMLKGMRAANELFGEDNPANTNEMRLRTEMLDQQLSVSLSAGRGLGLAEVFGRQLEREYGSADEPRAAAVLAQERLGERSIEAVTARATRMLPPVVRSALAVIEPVVREVREHMGRGQRFTGKQDFVSALLPEARRAAAELGVDHRVLLAQAALETGWGQSVISDSAGRSSHNLFNIKAGSFWEGRSVGVTTLEFSNGIPHPQRARFRAYSSYGESFADYVRLLRENGRYSAALANAADPAEFIRGLQRAGYATDPAYASKVQALLGDAAIAGAR